MGGESGAASAFAFEGMDSRFQAVHGIEFRLHLRDVSNATKRVSPHRFEAPRFARIREVLHTWDLDTHTGGRARHNPSETAAWHVDDDVPLRLFHRFPRDPDERHEEPARVDQMPEDADQVGPELPCERHAEHIEEEESHRCETEHAHDDPGGGPGGRGQHDDDDVGENLSPEQPARDRLPGDASRGNRLGIDLRSFG